MRRFRGAFCMQAFFLEGRAADRALRTGYGGKSSSSSSGDSFGVPSFLKPYLFFIRFRRANAAKKELKFSICIISRA